MDLIKQINNDRDDELDREQRQGLPKSVSLAGLCSSNNQEFADGPRQRTSESLVIISCGFNADYVPVAAPLLPPSTSSEAESLISAFITHQSANQPRQLFHGGWWCGRRFLFEHYKLGSPIICSSW